MTKIPKLDPFKPHPPSILFNHFNFLRDIVWTELYIINNLFPPLQVSQTRIKLLTPKKQKLD